VLGVGKEWVLIFDQWLYFLALEVDEEFLGGDGAFAGGKWYREFD
jgi:hypothetical protein